MRELEAEDVSPPDNVDDKLQLERFDVYIWEQVGDWAYERAADSVVTVMSESMASANMFFKTNYATRFEVIEVYKHDATKTVEGLTLQEFKNAFNLR